MAHLRKVVIYTVFTKEELRKQALVILDQRKKALTILKGKKANPKNHPDSLLNLFSHTLPWDNKEITLATEIDEKSIFDILGTLPKKEFKYNGYFHTWSIGDNNPTKGAIGIIEKEDGTCCTEPVNSVKFCDWIHPENDLKK